MGYLEEQRDVVLDALRHAGDLLARKGTPWDTTLWTRTADDAAALREMLHTPVRTQAAEIDATADVRVEVMESRKDSDHASRWGVRVELSFPVQ